MVGDEKGDRRSFRMDQWQEVGWRGWYSSILIHRCWDPRGIFPRCTGSGDMASLFWEVRPNHDIVKMMFIHVTMPCKLLSSLNGSDF